MCWNEHFKKIQNEKDIIDSTQVYLYKNQEELQEYEKLKFDIERIKLDIQQQEELKNDIIPCFINDTHNYNYENENNNVKLNKKKNENKNSYLFSNMDIQTDNSKNHNKGLNIDLDLDQKIINIAEWNNEEKGEMKKDKENDHSNNTKIQTSSQDEIFIQYYKIVSSLVSSNCHQMKLPIIYTNI